MALFSISSLPPFSNESSMISSNENPLPEFPIDILNSSEDNDNLEIKNELSIEDNNPKNAKKEAKKLAKSLKRMKREGNADPSVGKKPCHICAKQVDLLIRCQVDASQVWKMVCGKCWHKVSGGVTDGDANHPHYRYGGLWKNR